MAGTGKPAAERVLALFALDFDGVLCDSSQECAVSAWRAGQALWSAWQGAEPPPAYVRRFCRLRPLVETGYQCIPLLRLIDQDWFDEAIADDFPARVAEILVQAGISADECAHLFSQARADWLAVDEADWLARHRFYKGVVERFQARLAEDQVFIVTTKEGRFVQRLLAGQGVDFPDQRLFGLERGMSKEAVLATLVERAHGEPVHFVEDRLATLERVAACDHLASVRLYLAAWGYNTPAERLRARAHGRITVWTQGAFLEV